MRLPYLMALTVFIPVLASAQEASHTAPAGWRWRMDDGPESAVEVWQADSVWHSNTQNAGFWWDPAWVGKGRFAAEVEYLIYPESAGSEFGLIIGGVKMDEQNSSYIKFVVRSDGHYLVALRDGKLFHEIAPWKHTYRVETPSGSGPAKNVVRIQAHQSVIAFYLNGYRVFFIDRSMVKAPGQVALRMGGGIVADISKFKIEPLDN
ncbi:MAG: hypothetical protein EXR93_03465 [Gemmatimonadetes bacterium]|nr:hypothetical protein [Gemmatimonadota bacterium]